MNPRILHIIASSNFGGTENFLLNLSRGLTQAGITVGIICPDNGIFRKETDNVYYVDMKNKKDMACMHSILRVVKEFKPDIIHTHLSRASYIGLFLKIWTRIPVVATVHNVLGGCQLVSVRPKFWFSRNANFVYKLLTYFGGRLIAVSDYIRRALIADGVDPDKISVILNGTGFADMPAPAKCTFMRNEYHITDSDIVIGIVGGIRKGKGQILAVEAISRIPEAIRNHVKLVMVGNTDDEEYKLTIDSLAKSLNIQDNIVFAGLHTNMREVYADIDILLHPSYSEACSMAIIEAMSTARPVIVSNIPANSALVENNIDGCLVELNPAAIGTALTNLIMDRDLRASISANARIKAVNDFSLDNMTDHYIELYNTTTRKPVNNVH